MAIGIAWADGAWVDAGWVTEAWAQEKVVTERGYSVGGRMRAFAFPEPERKNIKAPEQTDVIPLPPPREPLPEFAKVKEALDRLAPPEPPPSITRAEAEELVREAVVVSLAEFRRELDAEKAETTKREDGEKLLRVLETEEAQDALSEVSITTLLKLLIANE